MLGCIFFLGTWCPNIISEMHKGLYLQHNKIGFVCDSSSFILYNRNNLFLLTAIDSIKEAYFVFASVPSGALQCEMKDGDLWHTHARWHDVRCVLGLICALKWREMMGRICSSNISVSHRDWFPAYTVILYGLCHLSTWFTESCLFHFLNRQFFMLIRLHSFICHALVPINMYTVGDHYTCVCIPYSCTQTLLIISCCSFSLFFNKSCRCALRLTETQTSVQLWARVWLSIISVF